MSKSKKVRVRRTKAALATHADQLHRLVADNRPVTVRQVYYLAVKAGLIEKTEAAYKGVGRLLVQMRREGRLPYNWLSDNTRWHVLPRTWSSLDLMLQQAAATYRRALWDDQEVYVEVWSEKAALAGVLVDVTGEWDVPLMVTQRFPSLSHLWEAAENLKGVGKPACLYYLGDHDPSGVHVDQYVERQLRALAPAADISFARVAVLPAQISEMGLPTRPTSSSDSRGKGNRLDGVEVDAIPPERLRDMVRAVIVQHVDEHKLDVLRVAERSERDILQMVAAEVRRR